MAIRPGYTNDGVREFVYAYEAQPGGSKGAWLKAEGVSWDRFRRWRNAIFDGGLDHGLIPREGSPMTSPNQRRRLSEEHQAQDDENARIRARIDELEATNEALGKAIGLLHQHSEQGPDRPTTSEPNNS